MAATRSVGVQRSSTSARGFRSSVPPCRLEIDSLLACATSRSSTSVTPHTMRTASTSRSASAARIGPLSVTRPWLAPTWTAYGYETSRPMRARTRSISRRSSGASSCANSRRALARQPCMRCEASRAATPNAYRVSPTTLSALSRASARRRRPLSGSITYMAAAPSAALASSFVQTCCASRSRLMFVSSVATVFVETFVIDIIARGQFPRGAAPADERLASFADRRRVEEYVPHARIALLDRARQPRDRVPCFGRRLLAVKADLQREDHVVGPHVQRGDAADRRDRRVGADQCAQVLRGALLDALADEQALAFEHHHGGDRAQQQADQDRRCAVDPRHPEAVAQEDAREGDCKPDERGRVLEHHRERRGVLAALDRLNDAAPALFLAKRMEPEVPRDRLEHDGDADDRIVPNARLGGFLSANVTDAGHDGHAAADGEEHEPDGQRPEIQLVPVAERVLGVGGLAARVDAVEHQRVVRRIDQRMDRLRQHRGTAGYGRRDEFDDRDREIAGGRRDDGSLRFTGHAAGPGACPCSPQFSAALHFASDGSERDSANGERRECERGNATDVPRRAR